MSNIKVQPQNTVKITVGPSQSTKVVSSQIAANIETILTSSSLTGLSDVDQSGLQDNYILQYDASSQKFKFVNPNIVLNDAVSGGLSGDFINALDTDPTRTDNIDFDGGDF